ncbi:MAG: hypothetical protein Q8R01_03830 [Ramlibacter sp.]|nr:hypothetical protein [Ramlibacter sp.]
MIVDVLYPLAAAHMHAVTREQLQQTFEESTITATAHVGTFFAHHGFRYGAPIVIVEPQGAEPDAVCLVWYDEAIPANLQ